MQHSRADSDDRISPNRLFRIVRRKPKRLYRLFTYRMNPNLLSILPYSGKHLRIQRLSKVAVNFRISKPWYSLRLIIFRTPFTNSFVFSIVALASKRSDRSVPEDEAPLGDVCVSFRGGLREYWTFVITVSSPTNDSRGVFRGRLDLHVGVPVIIGHPGVYLVCCSPAPLFLQISVKRETPDASLELPSSPPIAFPCRLARTRTVACCSGTNA